jgi:uncharacterized protein (DUF433 family)
MQLLAGEQTHDSRDWASRLDEFILLGDVLEIHRQHFPTGHVALSTGARGPDSCRVIHSGEIRQYLVVGPEAWAEYAEIVATIQRRRAQGSPAKLSAYRRHQVFAPLKILIAEHDRPLRAAVVREPAYPNRAKLGTLLPEQPTEMLYAALGMLNSDIGWALYRDIIKVGRGRVTVPDGPPKWALSTLPIAHRSHAPAELLQVVRLVHYLSVISEAEQRSHSDLSEHLQPLRERLVSALAALLHLDEPEARTLMETVQYPPHQLTFLLPDLGLSPLPPPRLLTDEQRRRLEQLSDHSERGLLSAQEETDLERLWQLRECEARLERNPLEHDGGQPWPGATEREPPIPVGAVTGAPTPARLAREVVGAEVYEYCPLGQFIVSAPHVCGGRPTFKYTRIEVRHVLQLLAAGRPEGDIIRQFGGWVSWEALAEARQLARLNSSVVFDRAVACA